MYRWGNREAHSYVLGVYTKKALAIKNADEERMSRGWNKYIPEITQFKPNQTLRDEGFKMLRSLDGEWDKKPPKELL
jgi:hypothetical protein